MRSFRETNKSKEIDQIFDDLKRKISDPSIPRRMWLEDVRKICTRKPIREMTLHEYKSVQKYLADFQQALNESTDRDAAIERFKQAIKDTIYDVVFAITGRRIKPTPSPTKPTEVKSGPTPSPTKPTEPVKSPEAAKEPTPAPAKPFDSDELERLARATSVSTEIPDFGSSIHTGMPPEAGGSEMPVPPVPPEVGSGSSTSGSETLPAGSEVGPEDTVSKDDLELGRVIAYLLAHKEDLKKAGIDEPLTVEEIEEKLRLLKNHPIDPSKKEEFISALKNNEKIVDAWRQAQSDKTINSGTKKRGRGRPKEAKRIAKEELEEMKKKLSNLSAITEENMTEIENYLKKIDDKSFKALAKIIDDAAYKQGGIRYKYQNNREDAITEFKSVLEILNMMKTLPQQESLTYKINKYKNMLRQPYRPEILIHEAAKLQISDRINFYRSKLRR